MNAKWGPHTIDRFASYFNTQLPRFNSRFWNPGSEAVDTFTCNWEGENNWWCPPVYLVPRTVRHAQESFAVGTLIAPKWPSASYWLMLFPGEGKTIPGVVSVMSIDKLEVVICPGRSGGNSFKGTPNTDLIAIRLDFRYVNPKYIYYIHKKRKYVFTNKIKGRVCKWLDQPMCWVQVFLLACVRVQVFMPARVLGTSVQASLCVGYKCVGQSVCCVKMFMPACVLDTSVHASPCAG